MKRVAPIAAMIALACWFSIVPPHLSTAQKDTATVPATGSVVPDSAPVMDSAALMELLRLRELAAQESRGVVQRVRRNEKQLEKVNRGVDNLEQKLAAKGVIPRNVWGQDSMIIICDTFFVKQFICVPGDHQCKPSIGQRVKQLGQAIGCKIQGLLHRKKKL